MDGEDRLFALFDDLEQQAEGMHLAEREAEVGELAVGEYAGVTLVARLHGARGGSVSVRLSGGDVLLGRLVRVGADWLQLDDGSGVSWLVATAAVTGVGGLERRAVTEEALPATARLSLRSALRALSAARSDVVVRLLDGSRLEGVLGRVGQDFVEILGRRGDALGPAEAVPLRALLAVREQW
jgi:small nuclear ribonucleoprotein (snRNP)-like protein